MCGYLIYKNPHGISKNEEIKIDLAEKRLVPRGPDDKKKINYNHNTIFYFRRLSIIDLKSSANQPFEIENYYILFNGEIYNHKQLKEEYLKDQNFKTNSDTEVILRLFIKYGYDAFKKLSGIYSITIFNKKTNEFILYRDPFGIKPLYLYLNERKLIVSSLSKIINDIINDELDKKSIDIFNFFGNLLSKDTIYENIKAIIPGVVYKIDSYLKLRTITLENIYDQNFFYVSTNKEQVKESLYSAINENSVADVDISALYSSGFDSNIIVENLKNKNILKLFTISTEINNKKQNEIEKSKQLNKFHQCEHIYYNFSIKELSKLYNEFLEAMDQPTIDGFNTFIVTKLIKSNNIKVALSGIGGDEYFGTYDTFKIIPILININKFIRSKKLRNFLISILHKFSGIEKLNLIKYFEINHQNTFFIKRGISSDVEKYIKFNEALEQKNIYKEIEDILNLECSDRLKITLLELKFYCKDRLLRDVDWAGMSNSIEIRVPFLNKKFHQNICGYLQDKKNIITKNDMIKSLKLERKLKKIKKQGFYVPYLNFQKNLKIDQLEYSNLVLNNFI